jgi:hypothetical protein
VSARRLSLAVAAAALAVAPAGAAKELQRVTACGADGCVDVTSKAHTEALLEVGDAVGGPTARGPGFVRLHMTIGGGEGEDAHVTQLYVPARDLVASEEDGGGWRWWTPGPASALALRRAARGIRPLPAAKLPRGALRTAPASAPAPAPAPRPATVREGPGGGMPAWGWAAIAAVVLVAAAAARQVLRRT